MLEAGPGRRRTVLNGPVVGVSVGGNDVVCLVGCTLDHVEPGEYSVVGSFLRNAVVLSRLDLCSRFYVGNHPLFIFFAAGRHTLGSCELLQQALFLRNRRRGAVQSHFFMVDVHRSNGEETGRNRVARSVEI